MVDPEEEALAAVQAAQDLVEKAMEGMLASTESLAASVLKAEREGGQMISRQRSREVEEERHRVTREENATLHALVNKLTGGHMSEIQGVKGKEEAERKLEEVQGTLSSAYGTIEDLKADVAAANHRVAAAVAGEGARKDAQCKSMLEAEARRAATEKAELEDRIMNLSVCRSSAVTVSEGVLKQQLSQARSEAELLKQEVARLKEELDKGMQARVLPLLPTPQEAGGRPAEVRGNVQGGEGYYMGGANARQRETSAHVPAHAAAALPPHARGKDRANEDGMQRYRQAETANRKEAKAVVISSDEEYVTSDDEFLKTKSKKRARSTKSKAAPSSKATVKKSKGAQGGGTVAGTARLSFSGKWPEPGRDANTGSKKSADKGQGGRGSDVPDTPAPTGGRVKAKAKIDPFDYC